jgi:hypothetical protein
MKKNLLKHLLLLVVGTGILLSGTSPVLPGQVVIDSNDQFDFARGVMDSGDHSRAIVEFERFIHFFPDDSQVPKARYLIGICYLNSGQHEAARKVFTKIVAAKPPSPFAGKALLLIGESYYKQGVFKEAAFYFRQVVETHPDSDLKNAALYRLGWSTINVNRWEEASGIFNEVQEGSLYFESAQQLAAESLKGKDLPQKNPTAAGAMAAILPGLGHVYVYRYRDATISFLVNGLFIWGAVQSFRHDQYVVGGMLTFLEIGWYSGNIYSAVNVAHKHNRKVQNDYRGRLKDRLDLKLFTAIGGQMGLALTLEF